MRSESNQSSDSTDSLPTDPQHELPPQKAHSHRLDLLAWTLLIGLSLFLLAATAVVMYLMDYQGDKAEVSAAVCMQSAGQVLAVTPISGDPSYSLVETTLGFYAVSGGIGLTKTEERMLQTRTNRRRYLCDASQRCMPLL